MSRPSELPQQSRRVPVDTSQIAGWGVDADPDNDPTYPMRDRSKDDGLSLDWQRPADQPQTVEVLHSIEYAHSPAVFGSAVPPRGLSGMIRRAAFRWSESNLVHWLLLMGADRIDVAEGVLHDLSRGKLPNVPAEMGARAEWRHNRKGFVVKAGVALALTAGAVALLRRNGR